MSTSIAISIIRLDGGTQPRAAIDQDAVNEYRDALQAGASFPPVTVFYDGTDHWLADGFHRLHAHVMRRLSQIEADVRQGSRRDAVLFSVGANASHGLRRTNEDKRRAVMTLLKDADWSKGSDREIARRCGVGADMVGRLRPADTVAERQYIHPKTGQSTIMQTANIGRPANDNRPAAAFQRHAAPEATCEPQRQEPLPRPAPAPLTPVVIGDATLYLGDCRDVLPTLGPISHILTDPPYEARAHREGRLTNKAVREGGDAQLTFGAITDDLRFFVAQQSARLSGGWAVYFCQAEGVFHWQSAIESVGAKYRGSAVWVKPDGSPKFSGNGPSPSYEMLVLGWCGDGDSKWNGRGKRGVYSYSVNASRHGGHQTEKPVPLLRELLLDFTQPGDVILDPFLGIGSLGVACLETGRKYIGVELDPTYFAIACERVRSMPANANTEWEAVA
jgi:site-specific DNA-methyltransferase (adenine-specific)